MLLKGVRVLDVSTLLPGPFCSMILADLGAEIIKVESPKKDMMRSFENSYFEFLNRSKKSIVIDLKTKEGVKLFKELAKNADAVIEGFRPKKMASLGLSFNELKKINPGIVYCSITGYGQQGKNKGKAGHDLNYAGLSALLYTLHEKPIVPGIQIADISSGFVAACSIIASLLHREKTGKGSYIDVSILKSSLYFNGIHVAKYSAAGNFNQILAGKTPCYNVYETKDGRYASLAAVEHKFWESFCKGISRKEREDILAHQFDGNYIKKLRKLFKSRTLKEWIGLNKKFDFCCEPVQNMEEVLKDKGNIIKLGGIRQVDFPSMISNSVNSKIKRRRAPSLGENTHEILAGLGLSRADAEELRRKKIVL